MSAHDGPGASGSRSWGGPPAGDAANHWLSYREPVATWVVDLPAATATADLAAWRDRAVALLEAAPVWRVDAAPRIGYRRDRHRPLAGFLRADTAATGAVDLFSFATHQPTAEGGGRLRAPGMIAWLDANGAHGATAINLDLVDDLGALLARLRPGDVQRAGGLMSPLPPLWVTGPRVEEGQPRLRSIRVRVRIHSDVWLPWVHGYLDDRPAPDAWFDNRPLARQHTPALNAALAGLADAARDLGGDLALDLDDGDATVAPLVGDLGVRLDAPVPGVVAGPG